MSIDAPAARVWEALTDPALIKRYLFSTDVTTDWRVGSPITYRGEWEGKSYEDKGRALEIEPETLLVSTFWGSLGEKPDLPENYSTVRYELTSDGGGHETHDRAGQQRLERVREAFRAELAVSAR